MLVKLKTNLGSNDFPDHPFMEGEEREVSTAVGERLIALRLAVDITPEPKPVVAQPAPIPVPVPKQEPAAQVATATAPKFKTSKEK